ncbi:zinc carboxypeptidase-like [Musca domestica]|uniref:Zinc carboxypeptidase-like n=1 Tax=Musca domestica TaxID=7370 RepID=A0ABM3VPE3_MUSDO|nr:zinc carboxypeptidase-like [Musca domestica]
MAKLSLIFVLATLVVAISAASLKTNLSGKVRYDNYKVYKLSIDNKTQLAVIELIQDLREKYIIWKEYDEATKEIHIMVNPEEITNFSGILKVYGFKTELLVENVQELIDEEERAAQLSPDNGEFSWTRYYELEDIEKWLDGVFAKYPSVTEAFEIGKSYEGRTIRGIKISYKSGNPGIFIESNIHAREWITSATATWFIDQLLSSSDPEVRNLAENYDWYIIPVFNVDGFEYSHKKDRMWRKTRQPVSTSDCIGTDANRNFDSHWMENGGASNNPCSETFAGPTPFSEPEAKALADFVTSIKDKINIYLSFHSYGQWLLSPYGHTKDEFPENYDDLLTIGESFKTAIKSLPYETDYVHGSTASVLYVASGSTVDWVFNELDVKVGYTIEFRDKGRYGFVLPPVQILPNCQELMTGMKALVSKSKELGYL